MLLTVFGSSVEFYFTGGMINTCTQTMLLGMSWDVASEILDTRKRRYWVCRRGRRAAYGQVVEAWSEDIEFCAWFAGVLADAPFGAFRWETPAVTRGGVDREFEFVLIDSPGLERRPEPHVFDEQIGKCEEPAVAFGNLGGDATLIVPRQMAEPGAYVHLAGFVRQAPREQVKFLFQLVGRAVLSGLGALPLWVSTAGMGVAWLHVRVDTRPKYYGQEPYML
jgi:hypothetical protein